MYACSNARLVSIAQIAGDTINPFSASIHVKAKSWNSVLFFKKVKFNSIISFMFLLYPKKELYWE